ncbi:MAG: hypothetical protein IT393_00760 [Nitrospirae bacterium]|nr:hypothetical protein [Nitrospirota bacterium]
MYSPRNIVVLLSFSIITIIMTYPLVRNTGSSIPNDLGDPLLNTWTLSWGAHKILEGDIKGLFNANIFHPYHNTLAYSESLLGNQIFFLPATVLSGNPVFAYNIVFLAGFTISAFGMYLLAYYLTGSCLAAVVAGMIFGFSPWRFAHLGHLQLQVAQWIPFSFLYLHKFIDTRSYRHLMLFTAFFLLQFLSCGYYGLFLSLFIGLFLLIEFYKGHLRDRDSLNKLGLFLLTSSVVLLPVLYPYIRARHEMGFTRSVRDAIFLSADIFSYFKPHIQNHVWGWIGRLLPQRGESELFTGVTATVLAITGITKNIRLIYHGKGDTGKSWKKYLWLTGFLTAIGFDILLYLFLNGDVDNNFFGISFRVRRLYLPVIFTFHYTLIWLLVKTRIRSYVRPIVSGMTNVREGFYLLVLLLSILLSLGPIIHVYGGDKVILIGLGPYSILHQFFPGFDGLRVPSRFAVMVVFAVSVLASFGVLKILGCVRSCSGKVVSVVVLSIFILIESASFPIPASPVAAGSNIPGVYKWLANQKGDFAILELPLPGQTTDLWKETQYMYYSIYHWKRLVNGYSGYFPPSYNYLYSEGMKDFPSDASIGLLRQLGIKYIILHSAAYGNDWEPIKRGLKVYSGTVRPVNHFDEAYVYQLAEGEGR